MVITLPVMTGQMAAVVFNASMRRAWSSKPWNTIVQGTSQPGNRDATWMGISCTSGERLGLIDLGVSMYCRWISVIVFRRRIVEMKHGSFESLT